ncbi:MAG TPA: thermonuclease family protein [Ramlibacter sp.]|jgi:endonuclease YncB( thermonuclease family)|uniref:thermonuclease family protein n=1 Tax=Ramlibacter sp. TaxID=1917967 RepID=UPI002D61EA1E|nr:thermonuclease family protein [Ramlibacter sp.]HZY17230.1 thermonuclease family protein [Ramlibacter sp.]
MLRCRALLAPLLAALLLPLAAAAAPARSYQATVTYVTDGDTVWVRRVQGGQRIQVRVQGIDAPEICQAWGQRARDALHRRLQGQRVTVSERGRDDYGRVVARLHLSGEDVGGWMVSQGLAWSPGYRRQPGPYDRLQAHARQAGRGLWSQHDALEPRRFRQRHGRCPPRDQR